MTERVLDFSSFFLSFLKKKQTPNFYTVVYIYSSITVMYIYCIFIVHHFGTMS